MKIESRKLEWNAQPRTKMVNENYSGPAGGDKKVKKYNGFQRTNSILIMPDLVSCVQIENRRLTWNASSKVRIPLIIFYHKIKMVFRLVLWESIIFHHKIKLFF